MVAIARPLPRQEFGLPGWLRPWMRTKIYIGGSIVTALILLGVLGPFLAPYDPNLQQLREALRAPQWFAGAHFFGTDNLGRDITSRLLFGARVSLIIAVRRTAADRPGDVSAARAAAVGVPGSGGRGGAAGNRRALAAAGGPGG